MKKYSLTKIFLLLLSICSFLAHAYAQTSSLIQDEATVLGSSRSLLVTASAYCDFLNKHATTDEEHLYNESMGVDPDRASILRRGSPGRYCYEVITGRENFPVTYVDQSDEARYCSEMDLPLAVYSPKEYFLASNENIFFATSLFSPPLMSMIILGKLPAKEGLDLLDIEEVAPLIIGMMLRRSFQGFSDYAEIPEGITRRFPNQERIAEQQPLEIEFNDHTRVENSMPMTSEQERLQPGTDSSISSENFILPPKHYSLKRRSVLRSIYPMTSAFYFSYRVTKEVVNHVLSSPPTSENPSSFVPHAPDLPNERTPLKLFVQTTKKYGTIPDE